MKKILLIEDCKALRGNTAEILEIEKYQVITADNGRTGVELALRENPDLIICDIMLPELDGYSVLGLLRRNPVKGINLLFLLLPKPVTKTFAKEWS